MAQLSDLTLKLVVDNSSFNQALSTTTSQAEQSAQRMESAFDGVKQSLSAMGLALSTGAIIEWAKNAFDAASDIETLSRQVDFSAGSLVSLQSILIKNGTNIDQFAASVNIMNANLGAAAAGNATVISTFDRLGLSVTKLQQMGPEQAFYSIVQALAAIDDQTTQSSIGRAIFGRSFADLIPIIKATHGELGTMVDQMNAMNPILDSSIKKLSDVHDSFSSLANTLKNDFLVGLAATITGFQKLAASVPDLSGSTRLGKTGIVPTTSSGKSAAPTAADPLAQYEIPGGLDALTAGLSSGANPGAGNNDDLKKADTTIQDYIQHLKDEISVTQQAKDQQAGYTAVYDLTAQAKQKSITLSATEAKTVFDLANQYEAAKKSQQEDTTINDYINAQKAANAELVEQAQNLEGVADYQKLVNDLMKEGLTQQQAELKIGEDRKQQIIEYGDAHQTMQKQIEDSKKAEEEWQQTISDGLTSFAFGLNSATDALKNFLTTLAQSIFKQSVADPFSKAISGLVPNPSSLFSSLFSGTSAASDDANADFIDSLDAASFSSSHASGGSLNAGSSYLVGENGPEIFSPNVSGAMTPNSKIGAGTNVSFTQVIQVSPGVPELIDTKIRQSAPLIASQAQAGVFNAIRQGGGAAKLIGLRS